MARIPLLQLNDISLTFGGDPVFENLSLVAQPGDRVALVGRNGSGKSTFMKVMAGRGPVLCLKTMRFILYAAESALSPCLNLK